MNKYYLLNTVVDNTDYFAERGYISHEEIYSSDDGISLKDKNIKIVLKKNRGVVRHSIENLYNIPVLSELVVKVLIENCFNELELFEVEVKMPIKSKYYFINILDNLDAIDFEKSSLEEAMPGTKIISQINKLLLEDSKIGSRKIFRLKHFKLRIIISETLKNKLEELNLSEFKFIPIEEFVWKLGSLNKY